MPGLGGQELSADHVLQTADALCQINPDIILLRTLAIPEGTALAEEFRCGRFRCCRINVLTSRLFGRRVQNSSENNRGEEFFLEKISPAVLFSWNSI